MGLNAFTLSHTGPQKVRHQAITLEAPKPNQILARATHSCISAGTESLVFHGELEKGINLDANLSTFQSQTIEYPFSYGYSWVGVVEEVGNAVSNISVGDRVFAFAPHQTHHVLDAAACYILPKALPNEAATLLPSMETALSIVHDTHPLAGEDICIFGQGTIGLLTTWILSQFPLSTLTAVDPLRQRHCLSIQMGADKVFSPEEITHEPKADAVIESSGNPAALAAAVSQTRPNGKVVVASWYGNRSMEFTLGTHFHRGRIQLISSQVSNIRPELMGTWTKARRLNYALELLESFPYQDLAAASIPFEDSEKLYPAALKDPSEITHSYFRYGE